MRILYLDCGMGAAGDMLTAALLELLPDPDAFVAEFNALGIPGVVMSREQSIKCGITGTHVSIAVNGVEEDAHLHDHHIHHHEKPEHHHAHDHRHGHNHSSLGDVAHIISHLALPEAVGKDVLAVYDQIAQAESHVHGVPVEQIHFHEVGTMDAIADVTAVCLLMHKLHPDRVAASAVHVGSGTVRCAHGILPVPAPATAYILRDVPIYGGQILGELCTPTGAALVKHFAGQFGQMPEMRVEKIGYGMGKKEFPQANCVRAMLGETADRADDVLELSCNVDDMTGEQVGFALERFLEAGALDACTIPIGMKKSRPGTMICVLCRQEDRETMVRQIFRYTHTLGIRETAYRRYTLERIVQTVETPFGPIRRKDSAGYGVSRQKYEYEDLARIAREQDLSIEDILSKLS